MNEGTSGQNARFVVARSTSAMRLSCEVAGDGIGGELAATGGEETGATSGGVAQAPSATHNTNVARCLISKSFAVESSLRIRLLAP
jgi:hypothetical protein